MRQLLLMSTSGCHLCDDAVEILVTSMDPSRYLVDEVDIAETDEMIERYGVRIPVLVDEASGCELGWPFDQAALIRFLETLPAV